MQDRFKFRVWLKDKNKMCTVHSLHIGTNKVIISSRCGNVSVYLDSNKILMQCTGLKDENGKLIYEGDILDLYVSSKKLYRYEVKYEIGSFMLVSQDEIFDFPNVWNDNVYPLSQLYWLYQNEENCIYQCKVIGNIYDNPELLEEEK